MTRRGRPRGRLSSRTSLLLLILLRESPADTSTLSYFLDKPAKDVYNYLKVLRKQGYVVNNNGFWQLTDKGYGYLAKIEQTIKKISSFVDIFLTKEIGKKFERNSKEIGKKISVSSELDSIIRYFEARDDKKLWSIISNIEERLGRQVTEVEHAVISFLVSKTSRIGRKYLWPPEPGLSIVDWLADETGYGPGEVARALRELEAAGVVFLTRDSRRGVVKIRLDRSLGV